VNRVASSRLSVRARRGRLARLILLASVSVLLLGAVGATPLYLQLLRGDTDNWEELSFIGQTYGAASAILSVFALAGIAISLLLQSKEAKAARIQAMRSLHVDLMTMAIDDPSLLSCWGPSALEPEERKQQMYVNLMVSHWQMMWLVGELSEEHLRVQARAVFAGPVGRAFWSRMADTRLRVEGPGRTRQFHLIMNEEYAKAVESGLPTPYVYRSGKSRKDSRLAAAAAGTLVGALVGVVCSRRRKGSRPEARADVRRG
jgi:hypothetical protein